jgi:HK97 family phage portal protein
MGIIDRIAERFGYRKADDRVQADWLRVMADSEQYNIPDRTLPQAQSELYNRLSWVQMAISVVAQDVALTAFDVAELKQEKTEHIVNHPFELRLRHPNPSMSRFEFLEATASYYRLTGNAFWWLNKTSETAEPDEIWVIPTHMVKPIPDGRMFIRGYVYENDGTEIILQPHEVVHFKRFNPTNPFWGLSPIEALATVATGDMAMQKWNTNYFDKDNAKAPGALAFADAIENDAWEKIKADVNSKHGGVRRQMMMLRNVGKGGVQWINMALSQRDMEFLAGREKNKEEIFGIYAPGLASVLAVNATEANSKAGKATLKEYGVWPACVAIAEKITNDVLPLYGENLIGTFQDVRIADRGMQLAEQSAAERLQTIDELRQTYYNLMPLADGRGERLLSEPVQSAPAQPDTSSQQTQLSQVYQYQVTAGIVTREEARAGLGLPPLPQPPPSEYKAKFEAIAAGKALGVPVEAMFTLMGLPTDLLPVENTITVAQPRQLMAPQDEPTQDAPPDQALEVGDDMRQQEAKAYRKWLKRKADRHWSAFKAAYLTQGELESIYAEVRQGVAPEENFFVTGKATRDDDMPGADGSDAEREALENKHAKRLYVAFQTVLLKVAPENTTTSNVTVDKAIERWRDNRNIVRDALVDMLTDGVLLGADVGQRQVEYLLGVTKAVSVTGVDWDMINVNALQWVTGGGQLGIGLGDGYANALLDTMTQTTENALRTIFGEWIRNNLSYRQLVQQLDRTALGRLRAEMIATTEITRAYAEGNRAAWRNSRIIKKMRWQAVGDERTCPQCGPLNQTTADVQAGWAGAMPPLHPRCRCWLTPVPVVEGFD